MSDTSNERAPANETGENEVVDPLADDAVDRGERTEDEQDREDRHY